MERYIFLHGSSGGQTIFIPEETPDGIREVCLDISNKYFKGRTNRQGKSAARYSLFVEIYASNGNKYCVYSYVNNDCIAANDREGQYFAISFLCKNYYIYPEIAFVTLEGLYNAIVKKGNIILDDKKSKGKYMIDQFDQKKDFLSSNTKAMLQYFDKNTNDDCRSLEKEAKIADYESWNGYKVLLDNANSLASYKKLCESGRLYISKEYETSDDTIKKLRKQIEDLEKDIKNQENKIISENDVREKKYLGEIRSLQSQLSMQADEYKKQLSDKDNEISKKEKEIESLNSKNDGFEETINTIQSSLEKYAKKEKKISEIIEKETSGKSKSKTDLLKIMILSVVLIFTIISSFMNFCFFRQNTSRFEAIGEKIKENKLSETQEEDFQQATYLTIGDNSDTITFGSTKEEKKEIKISTNGLWDIYNLDVINRNNWVRLCKVSYDYGANKSVEYLQVTIVEDNQNSVVRSIPVTITAGELRRDIIICQNGKTSISEVWYKCTNQTRLVRDCNDPNQTFIKHLGESDIVLKLEDVNKYDWVKVKTNDGIVGYVGINKLTEVSNN